MLLQHPTYPQPDDIVQVYTSLGLSSTSSADLWRWVKAAVKWWEDQTHYWPFLAKTQTRTYDPPIITNRFDNRTPVARGRKLYFDCGVLSIASFTIEGVAFVEGTDYFLAPANADKKGHPFQWVEFEQPQRGDRRTVSVSADFGFAYDIPGDAWSAMCSKAAELALPEIINLIDKGMVSWTDGDTSETYGVDSLGNQGRHWANEASTTALRYMRVL